MVSLQERLEAVEGQAVQERGGGGDYVDTEGVGAGNDGKQQRSVSLPRRVCSELITEEAEPDEELVYGAAAELVVEWREACAERKLARHTLAWLLAERVDSQGLLTTHRHSHLTR